MINESEFLERYYHEDILKLAREYPDRKMLIIDYHNLERFDLDTAHYLLENPDSELHKLTDALRDYSLPIDSIDKAKVSIKNLPATEKISISKIGSGQVSKLIAIEGRINKVGPIRAKLLSGAFKCRRCGYTSIISQSDNGKYTEPFECENDVCGRKGTFDLVKEESTWIDEQILGVQDLYENLKPGQPLREIIVIVRGQDLIDTIPAIGAQVTVTGIVRTTQKIINGSLSSIFETFIEALHIEAVEPDINLSITAADKKELKQIAANSNIFDILVKSTAPTILGYSEIKLALLAAEVSGPNYVLSDGRNLRGYVHVAICGDPGTAKTVMVDSTRSLVPRSQYAAGRGASGVGLTVSVTKDELSGSGFTAQAGALVLADKGLMVIDEVDKFKPEELQVLNTVLENGKIPVNKGGLNQTFNARCPVIALLNPKDIRFDNHEQLTSQIRIPADTLSRFDLVFLIQDVPNPDKDKKIAEHQANIWINLSRESEKKQEIIQAETLRKYIVYAKTFEPKITEEVGKAITDYFLEIRKEGNGAISATFRDNNGLFRLVKCMAKLRLSTECNLCDVEKVKEIYAKSREAITDPTTGLKDTDILYGASRSQQDRIKAIREIIQKLQNSDGGRAFFDDIVSIAAGKSITKDQTAGILRHLKMQGDTIEIKNDYYMVV